MKGIFEKMEREDLPNEGLKKLSDVVGINQIKAMLVQLPGVTIHVPKIFYKQGDDNFIRKNMDMPVKDIAQKLGCSENTVWRKRRSILNAQETV